MSEEEAKPFTSPLSPGLEMPEMHSLLHQAGLVEAKLAEIDLIIGDIWVKERKCYQNLHGSDRKDLYSRLLDLSDQAAEMQQVLTDLKQTQKGNSLSDLANQNSEESEQAVYKQYAYLRLLVKFQESSALTKLSSMFDVLLEDFNKDIPADQDIPESSRRASVKSRRRANSDEFPSSTIIGASETGDEESGSPSKSRNNLTFFDSLYKDFTKELKQVADLDKKLKESESRLKSRDEYLQNTIIETAKRTHTLEQMVADLQSEKEDLINDMLNLQSRQPPSPRLRQASSPLRAHSSMSTITMQEIQEEKEVEKWIMDANVSQGHDSAVQVDDPADHEELMALTQTLTTLAEEKELLESDLCIVRLQVEHLEAISRERDVILNDLVKKRRETQFESPKSSRRISRMSRAY